MIGAAIFGAVAVILAATQLTVQRELLAVRRELERVQSFLNEPHLAQRKTKGSSQWLARREPFAGYRSCETNTSAWLGREQLEAMMLHNRRTLKITRYAPWPDKCYQSYIVMHAFHLSWIDRNTTTLSEMKFLIDDQQSAQDNSIEVRNTFEALHPLKLWPPMQSPPESFDAQSLVNIHSALVKDLNISTGFRTNHAAVVINQQSMPQPEEIPFLIDIYAKWLNEELAHLFPTSQLQGISFDPPAINEILVTKALALACDAHTRLLHIRPFSDGNGRLARIVSGMVLSKFRLPMPIFVKEERDEYVRAVSAATEGDDPNSICRLHAKAVERSLEVFVRLVKEDCQLL